VRGVEEKNCKDIDPGNYFTIFSAESSICGVENDKQTDALFFSIFYVSFKINFINDSFSNKPFRLIVPIGG
jgi:hypothetical protein